MPPLALGWPVGPTVGVGVEGFLVAVLGVVVVDRGVPAPAHPPGMHRRKVPASIGQTDFWTFTRPALFRGEGRIS